MDSILNLCYIRATSCLSYFMILLENDLPGSLPILQVSFQSYLPSEKNLPVLDYQTRLFFRALNIFFL